MLLEVRRDISTRAIMLDVPVAPEIVRNVQVNSDQKSLLATKHQLIVVVICLTSIIRVRMPFVMVVG